MLRQPEIYSATELKEWSVSTQLSSGKWVPARPEGHNTHSWMWRWRLAMLVLKGEVDVVGWNDNRR